MTPSRLPPPALALLVLRQPRQAVHALLGLPGGPQFVALLFVYIVVMGLYTWSTTPAGDLVAMVLGSTLLLPIGLLMQTAVCQGLARLLGGQATWREQLIATVWGALPGTLALIPLTLVSGTVQAAAGHPAPEVLSQVTLVVSTLWGGWVTALMTAEIQRFSLRRALATVIPFLLIPLSSAFA